jgi:hypothetical protein
MNNPGYMHQGKNHRTKSRRLFLFLLCAVFIRERAAAGVQAELFVSPGGNGSACTENSPCGLTGAREKVRGINGAMTGDIVVTLAGGEYVLDGPLELGAEDGGSGGHRVIYRASSGGGVPRVQGGRRITGWTADGNGIFRAPYDGPGFRQLYVNGKRAVRARMPDREDERSFAPYYRILGWNRDTKCVKIRSADIDAWTGLRDIEMIVKHHWETSHYRIDRFDTDGPEAWVYFREPENDIERWSERCCPGWELEQTYYFENSIDFVDSPGEWFLDRSQGMVYYYPLQGESVDAAVIIAPALDRLLDIDGPGYVTFEGIVFEYANWDMPDRARVGIQAGYRRGYFGFIPGNIKIANAHHLRFARNLIRFLGGAGIEFSYGTHDNVIEENRFTDIAGNGIMIYVNREETSPPPSSQCRRDTIRNNIITRVARDYSGNVGINVTYVCSLVVEHNEISDLPYTGISLGWGWTLRQTVLRDNIIRNNHIHHVMQLHDDGAGIYTLSLQPGTVVSENWVHDIRRSYWAESYPVAGVYLDQGSSLILVEDNVISNVSQKTNCNKCIGNTWKGNDSDDPLVKNRAGPQIEPPLNIEHSPRPFRVPGTGFSVNTGDGVSISTRSHGPVIIRIFSLSGRLMHSFRGTGPTVYRVPSARFSSGVYIVKAQSAESLFMEMYTHPR